MIKAQKKKIQAIFPITGLNVKKKNMACAKWLVAWDDVKLELLGQ
jgi:hypothetical protein